VGSGQIADSGTKDAEFIAEQDLGVLAGLLGFNSKGHFGVAYLNGRRKQQLTGSHWRLAGEMAIESLHGLPDYGWMPHNAGFGFLDIARATRGQIHF
jgi:hypothetical protein